MKILPDFSFEKQSLRRGYQTIIGVDEVGRGALAGPVVAAAVVLLKKNSSFKRTVLSREESFWQDLGVDDSKRLTAKKRERLDKIIRSVALWGVGEVGVATINKLGIVKATEKAMRSAIKQVIDPLKIDFFENLDQDVLSSRILDQKHLSSNFKKSRVFMLVDAFHVKYIPGVGLKNQKAIIKGDQKVLSIAAASIVAKVYRDNLMAKAKGKYGWKQNKGYGTKRHLRAIKKFGLTRFHRLQFCRDLI